MKKILVLVAVLASMIGCSNDNKIVIRNDTGLPISLNFRAQVKDIGAVAPNNEQTIKDIPNGTYSYNTTYTVPRAGHYTNGEGAAGGEISFEKQKTAWLFIYSSTYSEADSTYTVYLNKTSSTSSTSANPTSN